MFMRAALCRNAREMADLSYPKFWQIFGKMDFDDNFPDEGKA